MRSEELRLALARTLIDAQMDMVDREQEWAGVKRVRGQAIRKGGCAGLGETCVGGRGAHNRTRISVWIPVATKGA